jgi:vancomycin aglycone glucosyltransferase
MRVLLSTIGSRGDVQPIVALGSELKARRHDVMLCVPPDFRDWIEGLGLPVTPIGPTLRSTAKAPAFGVSITPEQRRRMLERTVAAQFETIASAARGADLIVGATALQVAAPSVAESMGIPYVFAALCPTVLPSRHHAPPVLSLLGDAPPQRLEDYSDLWVRDAQRWNGMWLPLINARRESLGLEPIDDVRSYVHTPRPWLASDATLGPWPDAASDSVVQTGAWILPDERPLAPEVHTFLDAGEPPVYCGFGSIRAPDGLARIAIESVRALGRRTILSRGWADLQLVDAEPDCLAIGEVNQQALFSRVAAVVHHGGAGTTHAAARGGAPQVIIPQHYDQHYWSQRVEELGVGVRHESSVPTTESLTRALERALEPGVASRARALAPRIRGDGARVAAERLTIVAT